MTLSKSTILHQLLQQTFMERNLPQHRPFSSIIYPKKILTDCKCQNPITKYTQYYM